MTSFIAKVRERRAEITAQIAALVAERDDLDAVDRVYVRLSGDGADIAGDEPADQSTAARKDVRREEKPLGTGNAGGGSPGSNPAALSQAGTQAAPVDTNSQAKVSTGNGGSNAPLDSAPASGEASRLSGGSGTAATIPAGQSGEGAGEASPAGASSPAPTRTARIRELHAAHPELTAREAAERLGMDIYPLRELTRRAGLAWAPAQMGRPRKEKADGPTRSAPPITPSTAPTERTSPSVSIAKPMVKPKGTRFYLTNDAGEYLHFSCTQMTDTKAYAWVGDEVHMRNVRKKFEIARDLREVPVRKEQAAPINREVA